MTDISKADISNATPRPWQWGGKSMAWIEAGGRSLGVHMHPANAALIVRAVNSHDALVVALRLAETHIRGETVEHAIVDYPTNSITLGAALRAALAAAEEPQT